MGCWDFRLRPSTGTGTRWMEKAWSDDDGSLRLGLPANREGAHTSVFSSSRVGVLTGGAVWLAGAISLLRLVMMGLDQGQ